MERDPLLKKKSKEANKNYTHFTSIFLFLIIFLLNASYFPINAWGTCTPNNTQGIYFNSIDQIEGGELYPDCCKNDWKYYHYNADTCSLELVDEGTTTYMISGGGAGGEICRSCDAAEIPYPQYGYSFTNSFACFDGYDAVGLSGDWVSVVKNDWGLTRYPDAPEKDEGTDNNCNGYFEEIFRNNYCLQPFTGSTVDVASGNLQHSQVLFSIMNGAVPFEIVLYYNSLDVSINSHLGLGWTHTFELKLDYMEHRDNTPYYVFYNGYGKTYMLNNVEGTNLFKPDSEAFPKLVINADDTRDLIFRNNIVYQFDNLNQLERIIDRNNNYIQFTYANNYLMSISDSSTPLSRTVTFTYTSGLIDTIQDFNNNIHRFSYELKNNGKVLASVTTETPDGRVVEWFYTYDDEGYMLSKTDPENFVTTYQYNDDKMLEQANESGSTTVIDYIGHINILSAAQTRFNTVYGDWIYWYEVNYGGPLSIESPTGNTKNFDYYPFLGLGHPSEGKLREYTDENGNVKEYTYDGTGNVETVSLLVPGLPEPSYLTTTFTYNTLNQVTSVTYPDSNSIHYTYDLATGNLTKFEDQSLHATDFTYFSDGTIETITNPASQVLRFTYDDYNKVQTMTDETTGAITQFTHDISGNMTSMTDANNHTVHYEYDGLNQLTEIKDHNLNLLAKFGYDNKGNLTSLANAETIDTPVTMQYNHKGQVTEIRDPLGNVTTLIYGSGAGCPNCGDTGRKLTTIVDANGKETNLRYDNSGNIISNTDALDNPILFDTLPNGLIESLEDPAHATTTIEYNERNLVTRRIDPLDQATSYTYTDGGRLESRTDRKGDTVSYTWTPEGNIDTITYPGDVVTDFDYDILDRPVSMQDSLGTTSYVFDDANRTVTVTDPNGFVVVYKYDLIGNLSEMTYPGNKKITYTYDHLNRLETVTDWLTHTATFHYDTAGRLDYVDNFNGTVTDYGYDLASRLTSLENRKADTTAIASYGFVLDGAGNRIESTVNEPLSVTIGEDSTDYAYNAKKNRLETAGPDTLTYDNEGQLETKNTEPFTFDYEHRLTNVQQSAFSAQYYYDGLGNRLKATRNGVTTYYIYDLYGNLLAEADGNKAITRYYIHGNGLMAMITSANEVYTYHFNAIGSTVAMTDMNQDIKNTYAYEPFGELTESETIPQPFKYVGQYGVMHEPNGFYYMRARYYDPEVGRFISEDPIGFEGGTVNLYEYVNSSPTNLIDPDGLDPLTPPGYGLPDGYTPATSPDGTNPVTKCHVAPHNDPYENILGGVIVGGPVLIWGATELVGITGYELVLWRYANAGGIGLNLLNKGRRIIGLDWHKFGLGGRMVNRPHLDIPKLGLRHWPWK